MKPARTDEVQSVPEPGPDLGEVVSLFEGFDETLAAAGLVAQVRAALADGSSLAALEEGMGPALEAVVQAAMRDGVNAAAAASGRGRLT